VFSGRTVLKGIGWFLVVYGFSGFGSYNSVFMVNGFWFFGLGQNSWFFYRIGFSELMGLLVFFRTDFKNGFSG
jgi:hypothetical protein